MSEQNYVQCVENDIQDYVQNVKDNIQEDLEYNNKENDENYSTDLGDILFKLLKTPENSDYSISTNIITETEQRIMLDTGKEVHFQETIKCPIAIHELYKQNDVDGLKELREYVDELIFGKNK